MMEWILIKDRLPENGQIVVIYQEVGKWESASPFVVCLYDDDFQGSWVDDINNPKYWMLLPSLPNKEKII